VLEFSPFLYALSYLSSNNIAFITHLQFNKSCQAKVFRKEGRSRKGHKLKSFNMKYHRDIKFMSNVMACSNVGDSVSHATVYFQKSRVCRCGMKSYFLPDFLPASINPKCVGLGLFSFSPLGVHLFRTLPHFFYSLLI